MPRPKKEGKKISLFLKKDLVDALRINADSKGQTLTTAMEFAIKEYLSKDNETSYKNNETSKEV